MLRARARKKMAVKMMPTVVLWEGSPSKYIPCIEPKRSNILNIFRGVMYV